MWALLKLLKHVIVVVRMKEEVKIVEKIREELLVIVVRTLVTKETVDSEKFGF
jgi:hypothetical protein